MLKQFAAWQVVLLSDNGVQRSACIWPDALSHFSVKQSVDDSIVHSLFAQFFPTIPTRDLAKAMFAD